MSTVKIDKDVFIRDRYGVRIRAFVAGTEVDQEAYDKAVNPQDHPTSTGVHIPKSPMKDSEMENKMLPEAKKATEVKTEVVGEPTEELEAQEGAEENKKKPAKADAKAKK